MVEPHLWKISELQKQILHLQQSGNLPVSAPHRMRATPTERANGYHWTGRSMCLLGLACFRLFTALITSKAVIFFLPPWKDWYRRTIWVQMALAMTTRIMLLSAVSIMVGASLAYGSPACMTISEARAKFPKTKHLYWHGSEHCWNDSAAYGFRALAVVPLASPRRAFAAVPRASTRPTPTSSPSPETLEPTSMTEGAGPQCRFLPCE